MFIIMLALFSFRLFPLESFLHFKGKIMVIIIIPAVVLFVGHCGVLCVCFAGGFYFSGGSMMRSMTTIKNLFCLFSCLKCPLVVVCLE